MYLHRREFAGWRVLLFPQDSRVLLGDEAQLRGLIVLIEGLGEAQQYRVNSRSGSIVLDCEIIVQ
jgi:hypothetical protein